MPALGHVYRRPADPPAHLRRLGWLLPEEPPAAPPDYPVEVTPPAVWIGRAAVAGARRRARVAEHLRRLGLVLPEEPPAVPYPIEVLAPGLLQPRLTVALFRPRDATAEARSRVYLRGILPEEPPPVPYAIEIARAADRRLQAFRAGMRIPFRRPPRSLPPLPADPELFLAPGLASYDLAPTAKVHHRQQSREIAEVVNGVMGGQMNVTGEVTLGAGATTTIVVDARAHAASVVLLMPATAAALSGYDPATTYVLAVAAGAITIAHPPAPAGARFRYVILG